MNLTKDRINALEQSLNEQRIQFELEGDREDFLRLIAYWKSQQPKVCRHCNHELGVHEFATDKCPFKETTYEE